MANEDKHICGVINDEYRARKVEKTFGIRTNQLQRSTNTEYLIETNETKRKKKGKKWREKQNTIRRLNNILLDCESYKGFARDVAIAQHIPSFSLHRLRQSDELRTLQRVLPLPSTSHPIQIEIKQNFKSMYCNQQQMVGIKNTEEKKKSSIEPGNTHHRTMQYYAVINENCLATSLAQLISCVRIIIHILCISRKISVQQPS